MTHLPMLLLASLTATPCGDTQPPRARIDFPLPSALTDAETIRVRGSASDESGVAAVRVNGVSASTADGFAIWWAVVPLKVGENELVVETVDVVGNLDPAAAKTIVRREGAILQNADSVVLEPSGRRMWISDHVPDPGKWAAHLRVVEIDRVTGESSIVSSRSMGKGPLPAQVRLRFDPHSGGALCVDPVADTILHIDLDTGDRTIVSGAGVGTGTTLIDPKDLAVDAQRPRAWVVHAGGIAGHLLEVDLLTGKRIPVSSKSHGSGPWPSQPIAVGVVPGGQRALIQFDEDFWRPDGFQLVGVDLESGDRALVTVGPESPWRPWTNPTSVVVPDTSTAFVGDYSPAGVYVVDIATGQTQKTIGYGAPVNGPAQVRDLAWDQARNALLIVDDTLSTVFTGAPSSGDLAVLHRTSIGEGPPFWSYTSALEVDPRFPQRALAVDHKSEDLLAFDLLCGSRTVVSGKDVGSGPLWLIPVDLALDSSAPAVRGFVLDSYHRSILGVDFTTGDRTIVTSQSVGVGPPFLAPWNMCSDPHSGRLLVVDAKQFYFDARIIAVDPLTGDRTILSDSEHGSGPDLDSAGDLIVDPERPRALIASGGALLEVDLASGDRSVFSGHGVGSGPGLPLFGKISWDPADRRVVLQSTDDFLHSIVAVDAHTGDRNLLVEPIEELGPGRLYSIRHAWTRLHPSAPALLVYSEANPTGVGVGIGVVDPWVESVGNPSPGWRAVVSR